MAQVKKRAKGFYDGWFDEIVDRVHDELRGPGPLENLEVGSELEIAICYALRRLLPERVGVCRGWIVDSSGAKAGDDIIVYDAARFPTLRGLGPDVALKERVPAEAVLAYIEVKRTLYAGEKIPRKVAGQSFSKACHQIAAVKALKRAPVPLERIAPRMELPRRTIKRRKGFPGVRNPWYGAVWALDLRINGDPAEGLKQRVHEITNNGLPRASLPDVIAAGSVLMAPAVTLPDSSREARPFLTEETHLVFTNGVPAIKSAMAHLSWAIEDILLGEMPWQPLLEEQLAIGERKAGAIMLEAAAPRRRRSKQGR